MINKKVKAWLLTLSLSVGCLTGLENVSAAENTQQMQEGLEDENLSRMETVTSMDEMGNIIEKDSGEKLIENSAEQAKVRTDISKIVNFRTKKNEVTYYKDVNTGEQGYTNGAYGADAAYLGTKDGKVKFMLSGVVGWVDEQDVQVIDVTDAKAINSYEISNGKLIHNIVQDMTTPGYATRLSNGPAPEYLKEGITYYSYDGHYFYEDYDIMLDDYGQDSRENSVNPKKPYYNYFQYLPFRSTSFYDGEEIEGILDERIKESSKLQDTGNEFVNAQNKYGINAILMVSVAANESGWGQSKIAQEKNNLFGLNAVDSTPGLSANQYISVEACIEDFANGWMSKGYLYPKDSRYKGGFLGNKASSINVKYASDPYWGEKAANIAWNLDKEDKDARQYTIGIKDSIYKKGTNVNVRENAGTSYQELYKTGETTNYAVLILNQEKINNFWKIQSDGVLNGERTGVERGNGIYNFDTMYAYISADYVNVVNEGKNQQIKNELQSISVTKQPEKIVYVEGEIFNPLGMQVVAQWSDGTQSDITDDIIYSKEPLTEEHSEIILKYCFEGIEKETVQKITVEKKAEIQPEVKPEEKPEVKPEEKPEVKPEEKPEVKPEEKPEVKPEEKPEVKPEEKPEVKPEEKPEVKPEEKPEVKPEEKPEVKPEEKPEVKPEEKPEVKPEAKLPQNDTIKGSEVVEEKASDKAVQTGDDFPVGMLLALAAGSIVCMLSFRKGRKL